MFGDAVARDRRPPGEAFRSFPTRVGECGRTWPERPGAPQVSAGLDNPRSAEAVVSNFTYPPQRQSSIVLEHAPSGLSWRLTAPLENVVEGQ
jgi:hypothetical protein